MIAPGSVRGVLSAVTELGLVTDAEHLAVLWLFDDELPEVRALSESVPARAAAPACCGPRGAK